MSRRSHAALLGLALAGCDSRALVVGESSSPSSLAGGDRSPEARCADAAGARVADEECWPTRHVGSWRGFVTGDVRYRHILAEPLELPSGEVLLEIDAQGTGTLSFAAEPEPRGCAADAGGALSDGADAGITPMAATAGGAGAIPCSTGDAAVPGPRPGLVLEHRYTLTGLSMNGASERERKQDPRVAFSLLIAEPWQDWCVSPPRDLGDAPCSCNEQGCSASPDTLEASLSLSRDGQALRGTLESSSDAQLSAGLELIRP